MLRVEVALITHQRPDVLPNCLNYLYQQTRKPDKVTIYASGYDSLDGFKIRDSYNVVMTDDFKDWGHTKRKMALKNMECDYLVWMNDDDQFSYNYLEEMIKTATDNDLPDLVYCDFYDRTTRLWKIGSLRRSMLTNGSIMVKKTLKDVPYSTETYASDWEFVAKCMTQPNFTSAHCHRNIYYHF